MSVGDIFNLQTKKVHGLKLAKPSLAVGFPEEQNWKWTEGGWVEMVFIAEVFSPPSQRHPSPTLAEGICINHFHFLHLCFICRHEDQHHKTFTFWGDTKKDASLAPSQVLANYWQSLSLSTFVFYVWYLHNFHTFSTFKKNSLCWVKKDASLPCHKCQALASAGKLLALSLSTFVFYIETT